MSIKVREEILALGAYPAGKPISEVKREYGLKEVIKLASNENPLGCSLRAAEAVESMSKDINFYPDASVYVLKHSIAKKLGVQADQVICGTGSDLLIRVICTTLLNPGDEAVMGKVTFSRYADSVKLMGGKAVEIPMKNHGLDVDAMVDAITPRTKIVWFCNPNNPTGTIIAKRELESALKRIHNDVLIVMDEAYHEYVTSSEYPQTLSMLDRYPNMVILRTFSKAYGLAGLRIGYGVCSKELAGHFNAVIGPFDINAIAQAAACAALEDQDFVRRSCEVNEEGKAYLYREFNSMGLPFIETQANFIMVNVIGDDAAIFGELLKHGIIVKSGSSLGMPGFLRVSIGSMESNRKFIDVLKLILKK